MQIRDQEIPGIRNSLDALAYNLSNSVNTQQQAGYDLNGAAGGPLFTPLGQQQGAAVGHVKMREMKQEFATLEHEIVEEEK